MAQICIHVACNMSSDILQIRVISTVLTEAASLLAYTPSCPAFIALTCHKVGHRHSLVSCTPLQRLEEPSTAAHSKDPITQPAK